MAGWTFALGRVFGVEVRLHAYLLLLLLPSAAWASFESRPVLRGVALWFLLVLVLLLRELARAVAAACCALDLRRIILLPTGAIQVYGSADTETRANSPETRRTMALVGPIASILTGLVLAGLIATVAPDVRLSAQPWISPAHLVRALVWLPLLLGALNLLPAWPLDGVGLVPGSAVHAARMAVPVRLRPIRGLGFGLGVVLVSLGILSANWWLVMLGVTMLIMGQAERQGLAPASDPGGTRVEDLMLTDFTVLSASATFEDAMHHARHSLQDVFPVVRGGAMVGAVGRQNILEALASGGNGYVQGIMARTFHTASAADSLLETLNRAMAQNGGSLELVPVLDGDAIVGILTPQHLQRSLGLVPRRMQPGGDGPDR